MPDEVLPPPLTAVVDLAQQLVASLLGRSAVLASDLMSQVDAACDEAGRYLDETRRLIQTLEGSLPAEVRLQVVAEMERAFGQTRAALAAIRQSGYDENLPVLQGAMDALEESAAYLTTCARNVEADERRQPQALPIPVLSSLLASVRNRATDGLPVESVQTWLVPAVRFVARVERQVALFAFLHPEASTAAAEARTLTAQVQGALGAVSEWLESNDPAALDYARQALWAAWPLAGVLQEMDVKAAGGEFSPLPALEECYRYVDRLGDVPSDQRSSLDAAAAERVEALRRFYHGRVEALCRLPLAFLLADTVDSARASVGSLRASGLGLRAALASGTAAALLGVIQCRDASQRCADAIQALRQGLTAELDKTRDFPRFEKLRDSVGRLLQGTLSLRQYAIEFTHHATELENLYAEAGRGAAALLTELETQRQGYQRMSLYFQDPRREHLVSGLRDIESTLPRLRSLRQQLSKGGKRPQGVSDMAPSLLVDMTEWRRSLEAGQSKHVLSSLRQEKSRLQSLFAESRSRLAQVCKRVPWPDVVQAANSHARNMSSLIGGLELMELSMVSGPAERWNQGFEQARAAITAIEMDVQTGP